MREFLAGCGTVLGVTLLVGGCTSGAGNGVDASVDEYPPVSFSRSFLGPMVSGETTKGIIECRSASDNEGALQVVLLEQVTLIDVPSNAGESGQRAQSHDRVAVVVQGSPNTSWLGNVASAFSAGIDVPATNIPPAPTQAIDGFSGNSMSFPVSESDAGRFYLASSADIPEALVECAAVVSEPASPPAILDLRSAGLLENASGWGENAVCNFRRAGEETLVDDCWCRDGVDLEIQELLDGAAKGNASTACHERRYIPIVIPSSDER